MSVTSQEREREKPLGPSIMSMLWRNLLFLHWRWDPGEMQARLPPGLAVDTYDGAAWLGVVPLFMRRVRPSFLPPLPWVSNFLELNVRTYVVDAHGRPGVWFFSLAANQPLAVIVARRAFGLNYVHACMGSGQAGDGRLRYKCSREGAAPAIYEYRPAASGSPAAPGTLEFFVLERYRLFAQAPGGKLVSGRVHHAPYEFLRQDTPVAPFTPAAADGFADPGRPADHAMVTRDVSVKGWGVETV